MLRIFAWAAFAAMGAAALPAAAQQKLDLLLSWVPGGDHAPHFYAKKMGWYAQAGVDLNIEAGKGSAGAGQRGGAGAAPLGISDMGAALAVGGQGGRGVGGCTNFAH